MLRAPTAIVLLALGASVPSLAQPGPSTRPAPALTGPFAPAVPPALAHALSCRPDVNSPDSTGGSHPDLYCAGRAEPRVPGAPYAAMINLSSTNVITYLTLQWAVGAVPGEDTVRSASMDSAYAATRSFLRQRLGPSVSCKGVEAWPKSVGTALLAPPRRQRMHATGADLPAPLPEYGGWSLVMQSVLHPNPGECEPERRTGARSRPR